MWEEKGITNVKNNFIILFIALACCCFMLVREDFSKNCEQLLSLLGGTNEEERESKFIIAETEREII